MKKESTTATPTAANQMRSEVLTLAWAIKKQNQFLGFGYCQKKAWEITKLKKALRTGVARFTFQKNDGEIREATGTLNADFFTYTSKVSNRAELPCVIKYFDLEKNAFRSFRAERFLSMAA